MSSQCGYFDMQNIRKSMKDASQSVVYQIRIKGHLGSQWADWFEGLTITLADNGDTLLTGTVADQAALHGLLKKVRDVGMPLVSVSPVEPGNPTKKIAKRAGLIYLIYIIATIMADVLRTKLIVPRDATTTAKNILSFEWLFRIGFMGDVLAGVLFLLAAWALYVLLKPVHKSIALLFLLLNLGGVAVQCINMLNLFAAGLLLNGADFLKVFQDDQLKALAMFFLDLHKNGFMIAQLFYGAWLFPLGYLVFKSGYLPKILGIILMVECFAWLMYPLQFFLLPSFTVILYLSFAVGFIGEFSLALWLLIMGAKDLKPAIVAVE